LTSIRTICIDCGEVEVPVDEISLELAGDAREGVYRFACPECGASYRRPASGQVVEALTAMGASRRLVPSAEPITQQEIAEFVAALDIDEWLGEISPSDEQRPND
jgi:predicted RNA-binding Zn-ribbon protein involved in translation (DUF1610 family)